MVGLENLARAGQGSCESAFVHKFRYDYMYQRIYQNLLQKMLLVSGCTCKKACRHFYYPSSIHILIFFPVKTSSQHPLTLPYLNSLPRLAILPQPFTINPQLKAQTKNPKKNKKNQILQHPIHQQPKPMKNSRLDDWQQFIALQKQRTEMKLSPLLEAMMDNCEYILHTEFDKNTKSKHKHKKRKQLLTDQYRDAFKTLNRDEKLAYYIRFMRTISNYVQGKDNQPPRPKGVFSSDVYSRSFNLKMWKHKTMRLDRQKSTLYAEKDNKIKTYILEDYLLRKSKNKQYHSFVLEAINDKPHDKSRTVHLGFKQENQLNQWYKELTTIFEYIQWNFINTEMKTKGGRSMTESDYGGRTSDVVSSSQKSSIYGFDGLSEYMSKSVVIGGEKKGEVVFRSEASPKKSQEAESFEFSPSENQISKQIDKQQQFFSDEQEAPTKPPTQARANRMTIIESIAKTDDLDEIEEITQREQKKVITNEAKENIFARIMPQYNLADVGNTVNYGMLFEEGGMRILGHLEQPLKIKMFLRLSGDFSQKLILNALTQAQSFKEENTEVQEISLKTLIKSENSAMMYLKIKAFNKLYRPRDFIFLRHVFLAHETLHIIDKSIQNVSFPPFTTIVRGQLCILWAIKRDQTQNLIIADINMNNQGYLNDSQNVNLVLKYLKGFVNIEKIIRVKQAVLENLSLFNDKWNIVDDGDVSVKETVVTSVVRKEMAVTSVRRESREFKNVRKSSGKSIEKEEINGVVAFRKKKTEEEVVTSITNGKTEKTEAIKMKQQDEFLMKIKQKVQKGQQQLKLKQKYSHMQEEKGQIDILQAESNEKLKHMTVHGIKRDFDEQGHVIISQNFIKTKYILSPLPKKQTVFQEAIKGHPIWKGEWIHDTKVGGIIFVNQKKIQDQKGVLKFILTKIGKNLLSGKSVLNISLPVDIFCAESNLQRLLYSLTYVPTHLQPAVKQKNSLERLKKVIAFGISNSPLYLNMQKPFNPILGQTFQCWIDGCPAYAEQISHHPPIAALLYEGRGFRMTAQLESKVELHMNSGCGTNEGVFRIKFEDGMEACYITPGGEVSGLTYGDRKFNMVGKGYYWIQSEGLFLELVFNPTRKGFFSVGKQEQPIDYFEGIICKVKPQFMEQFKTKRRAPTQKQILQKYGKVHGIWNKYTLYEQQKILNVEKQFPAKLQYQANPLPSDANWREDIAYRRILEISRSQSQKQRLEVFQRKDRKLRQANPNHHHHKK